MKLLNYSGANNAFIVGGIIIVGEVTYILIKAKNVEKSRLSNILKGGRR